MRLLIAACSLAVLAALIVFEFGNDQPVFAQQNQSSTAPDCQFSATITGVAASAAIPNSSATAGTPCVFWRLTYTPNGFTGLTLAFQGARDVAGVAGTFADIPTANILEGTNPLTDFVCSATSSGCTLVARIYNPWVRVNVSVATGTGSIQVRAFGYRGTNPAAASAVAGSAVNLTGINGTAPVTAGVAGLLAVGGPAADGANNVGDPVLVAGHGNESPTPKVHILQLDTNGQQVLSGAAVAQGDGTSNTPNILEVGVGGAPAPGTLRVFPFAFNGSTWDRGFVCPNSAEVSLVSTAYTQIVAGSGATVIRVCKLFVTSAAMNAPVVNTFTVGFGTCSGSPTEKMNAAGVTGLDSDFAGALRGASGAALCVLETVSNSDKVTVTYAQY